MRLIIEKFFRILNIMIFPALLFSIQSCSSTQLGEKLSNSFDEPDDNGLVSKNPTQEKNKVRVDSNVKLKASRKNIISQSDKLTKNRKEEKAFKDLNRIPFNPSPYRITIKLSGANPSSPSESVTRALIKAGVIFEVERIERVEDENNIKTNSLRGSRR